MPSPLGLLLIAFSPWAVFQTEDDETLWRYRAVAGGLPGDWPSRTHTVGVDGWQEGPGMIGYEATTLSRPIRTELANPTQINPGIATYYFEREFDYQVKPLEDSDIVMRHLIDDGAIFYLNGQEFARFSMPAGEVDSSTLAMSVRNATISDPIVQMSTARNGKSVIASPPRAAFLRRFMRLAPDHQLTQVGPGHLWATADSVAS